jgi:hypothetical protein
LRHLTDLFVKRHRFHQCIDARGGSGICGYDSADVQDEAERCYSQQAFHWIIHTFLIE